MKKLVTVCFLFLVMTRCELIINVDVPVETPRITLNSIFNPDSLWTATLSLNRPVLDAANFKSINNALVIVYNDNLPIDTLVHQKNGIYKSTVVKPHIGNNYEIRAVAEGYQTVTGKSHIPLPVIITDLDWTTRRTLEGGHDNTFQIKFKDDAAVQNYYEIVMYTESQHSSDLRIYRSHIEIKSEDPIIKNDNNDLDLSILINDIRFSGKEAIVSFKTSDYFNPSSVGSIIVGLRTVSEDYYNYRTTAVLQNNVLQNPFAQPVNVYNNIESGFGIFAGYSQSTITRSSPRPSINSITPAKGKRGDHIIIKGENLSDDSQHRAFVMFSGASYPIYAEVVSFTSESLEVVIPQNAVTGKIYINRHGWTCISNVDFEVID